MTRAIITQLVDALEVGWSPRFTGKDARALSDAAITAAREYLATEPSGERAELIADLRLACIDGTLHAKLVSKAADMLEADAQQAKLVPMTDGEIAEISERMEASDPTDSFWREFARAIEAHHGITPK